MFPNKAEVQRVSRVQTMSKLTIAVVLLVLGVCLCQAAPTENVELRDKRSPEPHHHRNKEVVKIKVYERTPHGLVKHKYKFRNYGGGYDVGHGGGLGGYGNAGASSHATAFSHSGPFGSIAHSSASASANAGSSFFR